MAPAVTRSRARTARCTAAAPLVLLALLAAAAPAAASPAAAPAPVAVTIAPDQRWPVEARLLTFAVPADADPAANQTLRLDVSGGWVEWVCCGGYGEVVVLQGPPGAKAASFRTPTDGPPGPAGHEFSVSRALPVRLAPGTTLSVVARSVRSFYPSISANATLTYRRYQGSGTAAPGPGMVVARGAGGGGSAALKPK